MSVVVKRTFQLRDGLISYDSLDVLENNSRLDDFKPKPCKLCKMVNEFLDDRGYCDLCVKIGGLIE